jgi:type II secretory pathway pseudopilin PulG
MILNLIPAPYRLIVALMVAAVALAGATYGGWKWRDYQAKADELTQAKAANKNLQKQIGKVADLQNRLRIAERTGAQNLVAAQSDKEKEVRNVRTEKDRVIAGLRADLVRLRDPWAKSAERKPEGAGSTTATAPGIVLPESGRELSEELGEYLVSEFARADEVAVELNYCRKVAREQNETCNQLLLEAFK